MAALFVVTHENGRVGVTIPWCMRMVRALRRKMSCHVTEWVHEMLQGICNDADTTRVGDRPPIGNDIDQAILCWIGQTTLKELAGPGFSHDSVAATH
jgi:hypothetical protein